jgi:hypothetical protein
MVLDCCCLTIHLKQLALQGGAKHRLQYSDLRAMYQLFAPADTAELTLDVV